MLKARKIAKVDERHEDSLVRVGQFSAPVVLPQRRGNTEKIEDIYTTGGALVKGMLDVCDDEGSVVAAATASQGQYQVDMAF